MKSKYYKERSRENYVWPGNNENPREDQLKLGCIMRIADSLEKIEKPYIQLLDDVRHYKQLSEDRLSYIRKTDKQIAGLKGYIKRLKGKK